MAAPRSSPPAPSLTLPSSVVDPKSGFCRANKTFYSLRPPVPLPPESLPLSTASYAFSLLPSPLPANPAIVDAATAAAVHFTDLLTRVRALAAALRSRAGVFRGDVAFVLSPTRPDVPVLYLALMSIGAVVSPANPLGSSDEIVHQIRLCKPSIAFATAASAAKLPRNLPTVLLDSSDFRSFLEVVPPPMDPAAEEVRQADTAAILYSSGTTGRVKGVAITHRNFIALIAGLYDRRLERKAHEPDEGPSVALFTIPLFHVFGFFMSIRAVALGETMVLMERFDFLALLRAIERHKVTYMPVAPPLVVAMAKSDEAARRDLSSLKLIGCGGAPLGRGVAEKFAALFPHVEIVQGYGMTETTGGASATASPEESKKYGSTGKLAENLEAKVVEPATGKALGSGERGELCLRGPTIMKGYVGDAEANAATIDSEGWLRTGDLCYIDHDGFVFIVDRIKELIKYKGYQVPPVELEHIIQAHPEVADAAVIPYPDEDAGEIPMAFLVRQPGSNLSEKEIMELVAKQVAPHKKIRRVAFVSSIPKSPAGKILRKELVKQALSLPKSKL